MDGLALLDGQDVLEVEDGLLPVGVLCVRAGGEGDRLVAGREFDVEPRDERVHKVVATGVEVEGHAVGQVRRRALVQVEREHAGRVRDHGLHLDRVDERLRQGGLFQRAVVEPVDVIPD